MKKDGAHRNETECQKRVESLNTLITKRLTVATLQTFKSLEAFLKNLI